MKRRYSASSKLVRATAAEESELIVATKRLEEFFVGEGNRDAITILVTRARRTSASGRSAIFQLFRMFQIHPTPPRGPSIASEFAH